MQLLKKMALVILDVKQVDVAEELNVTKGYIGKMLSGERNSKDFDHWLAKKIIEYGECGVSRDEQ